MKPRTENKIVLCQNCYGTLTPAQDTFCNNGCRRAKADAQAERDLGKEKMWVYLNKSMLDLCRGERVIPHEFSMMIYTGNEPVLVACFDKDQLLTIGDSMANTYDGWYREISRLNTSFASLSENDKGEGGHPHQPRVMRREGLLSYLCDHYGISTERNVAAAIGTLTQEEGHESPLLLFNTL